MRWTLAFLLAACGPADPDARLRAGDLPGAAEAHAAKHGVPLDIEHPIAEILATRARADTTITTAAIADAVEAARLLEQAPMIRLKSLDLSFARFEDLGAALDALAEGPALLAVGRAENLGDKDPYLTGGDLPWKGGRISAYGRASLATVGRGLDAHPPPKVVVVGMRDATGEVYVNVEWRDGAWWSVASATPEAAARLLLAAEAVGDYGGPALRAREGGGFIRK
jgi:hypothetical protein